jgi:hypothetical protein
VILGLFLITVLEKYVPPVRDTIVKAGGSTLFWIRTVIILFLVIFGYWTPNVKGLAGARFAREWLQDILLGMILGALNGYFIVGTLWWFMNEAMYPYPNIISMPDIKTEAGQAALRLIPLMPPNWLSSGPWIFITVGLSFLFVIIVFI